MLMHVAALCILQIFIMTHYTLSFTLTLSIFMNIKKTFFSLARSLAAGARQVKRVERPKFRPYRLFDHSREQNDKY